MTTPPQLALRSLDATWNRARWELLPADGNRYEVIDGVLYMSTAPSFFHQWIIRQIARVLFAQIDDARVGLTIWAPVGVFMPGCDPVQPDLIVIRTEGLGIIGERHIEGVPALLVEVLSPSNPTHTDRRGRLLCRRARYDALNVVYMSSSPAGRASGCEPDLNGRV
jgi:Uma2 family endonuclease